MSQFKTIITRRNPQTDFIVEHAGLPPLLSRIYQNRGIASQDELNNTLKQLLNFKALSGMEQAVKLLHLALVEQKRVLIVGDFDADGATSCAVAVRGLRLLGFKQVDFLVPNRFEYGYGLTPEIVEVAKQKQPDLLITVDNGISSIEGVAAAKSLGWQVLVTDHHLPGNTLPDADAIVNPNTHGDDFPSKNLAGVGVIFYVLMALRTYLRQENYFLLNTLREPNLGQLLDLVALGTVADVVPLDHNNRILVHQGLARIRKGQCCEGIKALLSVAGRNSHNIVPADLGFAVGPRLNAAGRLDDMSLGIQCLLTDKAAEAKKLAQQLDQLNIERKSLEADMQSEALMVLDEIEFDNDLPFGLCVYDESWHQGVIGIVASRLKERFHRPVIVFAEANEEEIKGSARSISQVHIRDILDAIATKNPGLIIKFGGHAMAAGLSLKKADFSRFAQAFDEEIRRHISIEHLRGEILSDGELTPEEFTLEMAETLLAAGPWGQGFPEPIFDGYFNILQHRIVGEKHLKMTVQPLGSDRPIDAIAFNIDLGLLDDLSETAKLAYKLDVNEYQATRHLQLLVEHVESH